MDYLKNELPNIRSTLDDLQRKFNRVNIK